MCVLSSCATRRRADVMEQTKWGPFEPLKRVAVPLWLAVLLKKKRRCRILPPPWLTPGEQRRVLHLLTS